MPDELQHLRATLAELDRLLAAGNSASELRALVARALADVDEVSAESARQDVARGSVRRERSSDSIVKRLGDAAQQFEDSHPTLFGSVGSVVDALSRMGI
ncbi:MAG TPA: DUF4404 family protein [Pirellulales bacterium]|nr:DUF4404 family protein [Pirellulales bacterium]